MLTILLAAAFLAGVLLTWAAAGSEARSERRRANALSARLDTAYDNAEEQYAAFRGLSDETDRRTGLLDTARAESDRQRRLALRFAAALVVHANPREGFDPAFDNIDAWAEAIRLASDAQDYLKAVTDDSPARILIVGAR